MRRIGEVVLGFVLVAAFGGAVFLYLGREAGEGGWLERLLERVGHAERGDEAAAEMEGVVPVVQGRRFLDRRARVEGGGGGYWGEALVGDVWVVYGRHEVEGVELMDEATGRGLGLSAARLRERAVGNLLRLAPEVELVGEGPLFGVAADIYAASFLVVDEVWEAAAGLVEGELVAAAPTRDVVLFTGSGSEEGLRQLEFDARSVYEEGSWAISGTLLVRRDGRWEVWGGGR